MPVLIFALACGDGGSTGPSTEPDAAGLAVGGAHACRLTGTAVYCWGRGTQGQLGIGTAPERAGPTLVEDVPAFVALTAGDAHTCGLDVEGVAWCWGSDRNGQLGLGAAAAERCNALPCSTRPQPVAGELRFRSLTGGGGFTCGIVRDLGAYCWGLNDLGQLGTTADQDHCTDGRCSRIPLPVKRGSSFESVSAGGQHTCALTPSGHAYCWGRRDGVEGPDPTLFSADAEPVAPDLAFDRLDAGGHHTCALAGDGRAYCWGIDALGAGPALLESPTPVPVTGGLRFSGIASAGYTTCGIDLEGAAYCWGPNPDGEIGREPVGSTIRFDEPAAVVGDWRFASVAGGAGSYCGITSTGTTACWGRGTEGQLGSGNTDRTSPVAVPGL